MSASVTYSDHGLVRLRSNMAELRQLKLRVGYQPPEGGEQYESGVTVAKLAAVTEFGMPDGGDGHAVPERSFIRSTLRLRNAEIAARYEAEIRDVILARQTPVQALSAVGGYVVGLIRDRLRTASSWAAALDPETADAKGHSRPLDETGKLAEALSWRVSIGRNELARGK